jgi:hypothetical protein
MRVESKEKWHLPAPWLLCRGGRGFISARILGEIDNFCRRVQGRIHWILRCAGGNDGIRDWFYRRRRRSRCCRSRGAAPNSSICAGLRSCSGLLNVLHRLSRQLAAAGDHQRSLPESRHLLLRRHGPALRKTSAKTKCKKRWNLCKTQWGRGHCLKLRSWNKYLIALETAAHRSNLPHIVAPWLQPCGPCPFANLHCRTPTTKPK